MKTAAKKVPRNFRLEAGLEAELTRRSELTGIPETTIVEEALRHHFAGNMRRVLTSAIAALGGNRKKMVRGSTTSPMSCALAAA